MSFLTMLVASRTFRVNFARLALLALPALSAAQSADLHLAYLRGDVSVSDRIIDKIGMGAASAVSSVSGTFLDATGYTLTVDAPETGNRDYSVTCRAYTDNLRDVLLFRTENVSVSKDDTSDLDFHLAIPGIVEGTLSLSGVGTLQSFRVEARKQSGSDFSHAWTEVSSSDGNFSFPVQPNAGLSITGYADVMVNGILKRFDLVPDTVDVAEGGIARVDWTVNVADLNYASSGVSGRFDLRGAVAISRHGLQGVGPVADAGGKKYAGRSRFSNQYSVPPYDYLEENLNPGSWSFTPMTFFQDASQLVYPWANYGSIASRVLLPAGGTKVMDVSADVAMLSGTFELDGAVKNSDAGTIGMNFRGTDTTVTRGGQAYFLASGLGNSFHTAMTEGEWRLANSFIPFLRLKPLAGQSYLNCNLSIAEHRLPPYSLVAGPNVLPAPIRYETGEVTVSVRLNGAATMSSPHIGGSYFLVDAGGRTVREARINAYGRPQAANPAEVTFIGLAGTYNLTFTALVDGTTLTVPNIPVVVTAGVSNHVKVDVAAPTLNVDTLASACVLGPNVVVSGKATDDVGIRTLTVNSEEVYFAKTGNAADSNEVSFSVSMPATLGAFSITVIATDSSGKMAQVVRTITVDETGPAFEYIVPASNGEVTVPRVAISGQAIDDVEVRSVIFTLNGVEVPVAQVVSADTPLVVFADSLTLIEGVNLIRMVATDGCGKTITVDRTLTYTGNLPPVAVAGEDRVLQVQADCRGLTNLVGSHSSDPDDDTLSYLWEAAFGTFTGVSVKVGITLGTYPVRLTVADGNGGVAYDTVVVTVVDTTPPIIEGLEYDLNVMAQGAFGAYVDLPDPVIIDECGGVSSNDAPPVFPFGTTLVTYTILTRSGSSWPVVTRVNVLNRPAALGLTASPVQYSDSTTVVARLLSGTQPLPGKTITFRMGGGVLGTAVTNSDGLAVIKRKIPLAAGTYSIQAEFPPDNVDHINGIQASAILSVYRESASIFFAPTPPTPEEHTQLTALVTQSNDGQPGDLRLAQAMFRWQKINIDGNVSDGGRLVDCQSHGFCTMSMGNPGLYRIWTDLVGAYYQPSSSGPREVAISNSHSTRVIGSGRYLAGRDSKKRKKHAHFAFTARRTAGGEYLGELAFKDNLTGIGIAGNRIDWIATDHDGNAQFQGKDYGGFHTYRVHCRKVGGNFDEDKFGIEIWNGNDTSAPPIYRVLNKSLGVGGGINIFH